jgi:hypothetical protein
LRPETKNLDKIILLIEKSNDVENENKKQAIRFCYSNKKYNSITDK